MSIRQHTSLASACASGLTSIVSFWIDLEDTDLDAVGPDGICPLCAAAFWGNDEVVDLLLDASCDPNARNADMSGSTALHAAAAQEHGKIAHLLLQYGANPTLADSEGRTACDLASVSEAIWPLFAARGLQRTPKDELVRKGVIRKVPHAAEPAGGGHDEPGGHPPPQQAPPPPSSQHGVPFYSRPGSAYVRADYGGGGGRSAGASGGSGSGSSGSTLPAVSEHGEGGIDPLANVDVPYFGRTPIEGGRERGGAEALSAAPAASTESIPTLSFWRDDL